MRGRGRCTFWSSEVDHVSVFFEHVDLLDCLDGLDVELFEGGLELFVVGAGGFVDFLYFSPGRAFASGVEGDMLASRVQLVFFGGVW